jgi:peptidoglycan hydrolase-like protein with peptidoglycan-binding domain
MHLLNKLTKKIKSYKSEHPLKFRYIIISSSGIAALTLSVIIVSSSSILKDSTPEKILQYAQNTSPGYTQKSTKYSRGNTSLDPLKGDIIKPGVKDSIVTVIQKKLTELDYIESDEPTEEFGETLENAVKLFQRKNELEITGEVNTETYKLLISDKAKKYTVSLGAKGTNVEQLQSRLYELGYIPKATGYFDSDTEAAVKEFQKRNGLYDDGNVGENTREKLYSNDAVPLSFYLGDENDKIKQYQERLYELGYMTTKPEASTAMIQL